MIESINRYINDPAWWFSTIFVALVVNIISALIYDSLKSIYASITIRRLLIACQICYAILILASCLIIQPNTYYLKNIIPAVGIGCFMSVLFDMYVETRYRFIGIAATFIVFLFNVAWGMIKTTPSYSADWFATQFFGAFLISTAVTVLLNSALLTLARKRRLWSSRE